MTIIHRLLRGTLGIAAAAAAQAALADHGAPPANYLGIQGGVNNVRGDWAANVNLGGTVVLPGAVGTKRGTHFGIFAGRQTEHARFELEYQHGKFDINALQLAAVRQAFSAGGDYNALTVNAYRTQPLSQSITAYAGLGIGWGRVSLPQMAFTAPACNCFPAASKSGFTWLARAGAELQLGDGRVFVQYTHLNLPRPGSGGSPGVEYARKNVGAVAVGYRHTF